MLTASSMRGLYVIDAVPRCWMLAIGTHTLVLVSRLTEPARVVLKRVEEGYFVPIVAAFAARAVCFRVPARMVSA